MSGNTPYVGRPLPHTTANCTSLPSWRNDPSMVGRCILRAKDTVAAVPARRHSAFRPLLLLLLC